MNLLRARLAERLILWSLFRWLAYISNFISHLPILYLFNFQLFAWLPRNNLWIIKITADFSLTIGNFLAISWQFPNIWHSSKACPTINKEPCLQISLFHQVAILASSLSSAGGPVLSSSPLLSSSTALCRPPSLPDVDKVKWKSLQFSVTVQQATPEEENSPPILTIFHKLS